MLLSIYALTAYHTKFSFEYQRYRSPLFTFHFSLFTFHFLKLCSTLPCRRQGLFWLYHTSFRFFSLKEFTSFAHFDLTLIKVNSNLKKLLTLNSRSSAMRKYLISLLSFVFIAIVQLNTPYAAQGGYDSDIEYNEHKGVHDSFFLNKPLSDFQRTNSIFESFRLQLDSGGPVSPIDITGLSSRKRILLII